jgi:Tol biopolymer transport system component
VGTPLVRFGSIAAKLAGRPTAGEIIVEVPGNLPAGPVLLTVETVTGVVTSQDVFTVKGSGPQNLLPIAFVSGTDAAREIYVMKSDGSDPVRLTNNNAGDWYPSWSPDRTRLLFDSDRDGKDRVYVMDADGSKVRKLAACFPGNHAWSPDGTKIAYCAYRMGTAQVDVMNADGSNSHQLTFSNEISSDWPTWSPDGGKIAFERSGAGPALTNIFLMNADGSNSQQLTTVGDNRYPTWWPGTKIAFMSARDGKWAIYVMNPDGSDQHRLVEGWNPKWLPDGRLVFNTPNQQLWVINADGSNKQSLTNSGVGAMPA